jgi:hypothetical protein
VHQLSLKVVYYADIVTPGQDIDFAAEWLRSSQALLGFPIVITKFWSLRNMERLAKLAIASPTVAFAMKADPD